MSGDPACVRCRRLVLLEAAAALEASGIETCARRRRGGYCGGYYERNLRCPDCPEEDGSADVVRDLIDAAVPVESDDSARARGGSDGE